jgi:hypothetical protein
MLIQPLEREPGKDHSYQLVATTKIAHTTRFESLNLLTASPQAHAQDNVKIDDETELLTYTLKD